MSRSQGPLTAMVWQLISVECHSIMTERINVPREDKSAGPPKPTRTQPVLTPPVGLSVQLALELYYSSVPICWNYEVKEYPPEFNPNILCNASAAALPQFSQEYTSTGFDTPPQVTLTAEIARIATRQSGASNASNASIIQQLKALLSLVTTQEDRNSLSNLLGSFENDIYKAKAAAMTKRQQASLFGCSTNDELQNIDVSFGLPLDTTNKSTQNTYQSKRRKL
jgi:hypothetical protein